MARGAVRGAMSAWLGLIVLQVVTTKGGSGKVAGAFDVLNGLVERALSPDVAAIPDHSKPAAGTASSTTASSTPYTRTSPVPPPNTPNPTGSGAGRVPIPGNPRPQ